MSDARPNNEKEGNQKSNEQKVNRGNGPTTATGPFLYAGNRRVQQVSKEDSKQKCDQRLACDIEKTES